MFGLGHSSIFLNAFNDFPSISIFQVLLSGGVDSTVCTALLNRALNQDQVIAVHIDNGFMRKRESQSVEEALKKLGIQVKGTALLLVCYLKTVTSVSIIITVVYAFTF